MKKLIILIFFSATGQWLFSQKTEEIKIESGAITKQFKNGKLDHFVVSMYAVNYGNNLIFSKSKDEILIKNAEDEHSVITISLKDKQQVKSFIYNNKPIMTMENIILDLNNLPKNSIISSQLSGNDINSFTFTTNFDNLGNANPDKSFKLFSRLYIDPKLDTIDGIFNWIGDFFSQEDALLKIYFGRYAEKYEPKTLAYLQTDHLVNIKTGVIWKANNSNDFNSGKYDIYNNGKITKSASESLEKFQQTYMDFRVNLEENK